uniref:arginine--tRNA ligase n=1 Tax=Pseudo-nitzschia australis TaxID=44445 RepID=A0A7S4AKI1_9STRA|mmetsp:Transcript_26315/g.57644  ORF Transcript_26315/g.57644 Transcript_26315/m.57644 type:complete len:835 (-) Transcript_26315:215-2719(-)|eukprot:CAMPEP_0168193326 /NCGR_PEP_ID=MMETSP0139_2-20121125/18547_1 /TAXON_ID=44445 /ORGANISM="Pseudo-nitzschia australis, Strain 10249 10 AB" /LENGTH=834 /DNA_ID=CAMNT_0008116675 /DNA_START=67 /DNA_END=2571 /DNA_ORIENTATION=+
MAEETKGPSKGELKKLAKKAEKAAKKEAAKAAGGAAPAAAGGAKPAAAASAAPVAKSIPAPKVLLYQGAKDDAATLKLVWAALHYGIKVGVAKNKDLPAGLITSNSSKKPVLIYGKEGDYVLGGGGNAMVKAIGLMGGESVDFEADEWCEVERTVLRSSKTKAPKLDALAAGLEASATGVHLVGEADTIADICVLVTLSKHAGDIASWPSAVQKYYQCHSAALERARAAVGNYCPLPPVNIHTNPSLTKVLTAVFTEIVEGIAPDFEFPSNIIKKCDTPKHGDYQCSVTMPAFASLKKTGGMPEGVAGPQQLAQVIIDGVGKDHPVIQEMRIQGPGFIMCKISPKYLQAKIDATLQNKTLPKPVYDGPQQTCLVDFSSPNIAKEMHVGHLRSTIIGEAVCRILEFVGFHVERINHVGDWGTQFGMLIQYLKEEFPDFASSMPNITDLTAFYKAAKERFDDDADFKKTAQLNVVKLQSGDEECMEIWKLLCDVSRQEFQKVYDRLDVTVKECGESFYNDKIPPVIDEFNEAGILSVEEGGAKCVFVENYKVPLMLQKSDGGFGYDSTDMAALKYRLHTVKATRSIYITDYTQGDHFAMCFRAARDIGWLDNGQKLQHIGFGTVQGEDGKRFKTRSGTTVRLVDLLDEAVSRMEGSLNDRIASGRAQITQEEVHGVAEAVGYGAVKYFDLRRNPTSNYKFSYDAMLDTKGNTAVYLLYARVRFESIMRKAKAEFDCDVEELIASGEKIAITHESERNLALQIQSFADVLDQTLEDLLPYHICDYVYSLSIAGSDFVTQCKVLGTPEMKSRLLLCHVTATSMKQCFDLLGIRHIKRI